MFELLADQSTTSGCSMRCLDLPAGDDMRPESQRGGHTDLAAMSTLLGFCVMMTLDVALD